MSVIVAASHVHVAFTRLYLPTAEAERVSKLEHLPSSPHPEIDRAMLELAAARQGSLGRL